MSGPSRRDALRLLGISAATGPLILAQELTRPHRQPLPTAQTGSILTADAWNAVVDRINELSERS